MPKDNQLFLDILQEQHAQLVRSLQDKRNRARAELAESIEAWRKFPGGDFSNDWKRLPGGIIVRQTNDDRIVGLTERLNALPEKNAAPPLETSFLINQLSQLDAEIEKCRDHLSIKRRQTELFGEYGEINNKKWFKEIFRFLERNPIASGAISSLQAATKEAGLEFDWITSIAKCLNGDIAAAEALPDAAPSDGAAYEHSCLLALQKIGWTARLTPPTGDQGADIIAKKNGVSVAIQCKNYRSAVGNRAIQEIHAGKAFYEADIAIVVSPSGYTASATLLAQKLKVLLIDHAVLPQLDTLTRVSVP